MVVCFCEWIFRILIQVASLHCYSAHPMLPIPPLTIRLNLTKYSAPDYAYFECLRWKEIKLCLPLQHFHTHWLIAVSVNVDGVLTVSLNTFSEHLHLLILIMNTLPCYVLESIHKYPLINHKFIVFCLTECDVRSRERLFSHSRSFTWSCLEWNSF